MMPPFANRRPPCLLDVWWEKRGVPHLIKLVAVDIAHDNVVCSGDERADHCPDFLKFGVADLSQGCAQTLC